jgi:hypothetical protein
MSAVVKIRCHFDGKSLVPDEPVDLPTGQPLVAHVQREPSKEQSNATSAVNWMIDNAIDDPSLPDDLSANLDHYLYGAPKRGR